MTEQAEKQSTNRKTLRLPGFADRINCSISTARGMVRRGEVDSIRMRRLILIPEAEVDRLLAEGYKPRLPNKS